MQEFQWEATTYLVLDGVLHQRQKTNEQPEMVLVSAKQKREAMEAAHELSMPRARAGALRNIVERYWWRKMYANVKDWRKMCEQCVKRVTLPYDKP